MFAQTDFSADATFCFFFLGIETFAVLSISVVFSRPSSELRFACFFLLSLLRLAVVSCRLGARGSGSKSGLAQARAMRAARWLHFPSHSHPAGPGSTCSGLTNRRTAPTVPRPIDRSWPCSRRGRFAAAFVPRLYRTGGPLRTAFGRLWTHFPRPGRRGRPTRRRGATQRPSWERGERYGGRTWLSYMYARSMPAPPRDRLDRSLRRVTEGPATHSHSTSSK